MFCIIALLSCKTYDRRDENNKLVSDYDEEIRKKPNDHSLYFRRARLYSHHCSTDTMFIDEIRRCNADMAKAMQLAGDKNAPFEYFALSGYCQAALTYGCQWDGGYHAIVANSEMKENEPDENQIKAVRPAIEDFNKAIARGAAVKGRDQDLKALYKMRALLFFYQKKYTEAHQDLKSLKAYRPEIEEMHLIYHHDYEHKEARLKEFAHIEEAILARMLEKAKKNNSPDINTLTAQHNEALKRKQSHVRSYIEDGASTEPSGLIPRHLVMCRACKGTGKMELYDFGTAQKCTYDSRLGEDARDAHCSSGSASGYKTHVCRFCKGKGKVTPEENEQSGY